MGERERGRKNGVCERVRVREEEEEEVGIPEKEELRSGGEGEKAAMGREKRHWQL